MAEVTFEDSSAGGQAPNPGAAAYACSRLGLRVFPLVPGTGTPALKEWPDYATTDTAQIRQWWAGGQYTGYGVGIACGPESDLWVLDIDTKKGVDGFASLLALRTTHRAYDITDFTRTMTVTTPSGGAHVYFRWSAGVVNSTSRLGAGLDVRADHGYVRAPGWGGYDVVSRNGERNVRIWAAPEWITGLAQRRKADAEGERMRTAKPGTSWAAYSTSLTLRTLGSAPEGTRNTALNKAAYKMGRSGSIEEGDAWAACQARLVSMNAGDDMPAWRRTFESGWNAGVAHRDVA